MADVPWPLWPGRPESLPAVAGIGHATWRVLAALWRMVDASPAAAGPSALWPSREAGRRPCVWPSAATLGEMCGLKERATRAALSNLEARGLIEGGRRDPNTWYRWLTDPEGADVGAGRATVQVHHDAGAPPCTTDLHGDAPREEPGPAPPCTSVDELPAAPIQHAGPPRTRVRPPARPSLRLLGAPTCTPESEGERSEEAAAAGAGSGCAAVQVRDDAGAPPDRGTVAHLGEQFTGRAPAGAAGSNRRRVGAPAPTTSPATHGETHGAGSGRAAVVTEIESQPRTAARPCSSTGTSGRCPEVEVAGSSRHPADQHPQQRPAPRIAGDAAPPARPPATTSGTSAGRRWDAVELIAELGMIHLPAPAQRIAADRRTRERAEQLLELPLEGLSEDDAQAARRARFEAVLTTAKSFARYLEATPEKRHFWRGGMLSLRARARADGGDGTSPWEAVEKDVAEAAQVEAELERGRQAAREHLEAEKAEAEKVAKGRVTPEGAAAGADEFLRRLRSREPAGCGVC